MREHKIRRVPVLGAGGALAGVVSLADLAEEREPESPLATIAAAQPNA